MWSVINIQDLTVSALVSCGMGIRVHRVGQLKTKQVKQVCVDPCFDMKSSEEATGLQRHKRLWEAVRVTRLIVNLENDDLA